MQTRKLSENGCREPQLQRLATALLDTVSAENS
jgi:hypothetical protein